MRPVSTTAVSEDPYDTFTISDRTSAKKYAITSYLKLLTARVIKLEQEMSRHKKVSIIMVGKEAEKSRRCSKYVADVDKVDGE